jgi:hypothetical protein
MNTKFPIPKFLENLRCTGVHLRLPVELRNKDEHRAPVRQYASPAPALHLVSVQAAPPWVNGRPKVVLEKASFRRPHQSNQNPRRKKKATARIHPHSGGTQARGKCPIINRLLSSCHHVRATSLASRQGMNQARPSWIELYAQVRQEREEKRSA